MVGVTSDAVLLLFMRYLICFPLHPITRCSPAWQSFMSCRVDIEAEMKADIPTTAVPPFVMDVTVSRGTNRVGKHRGRLPVRPYFTLDHSTLHLSSLRGLVFLS